MATQRSRHRCSIRNSRHLCMISPLFPYSIDIAIKDTTDTARSALYLEIHLQIDRDGRLWAFHLNVAAFQQYLHMECISRSCSDMPCSYHSFLDRWFLLWIKILNHGFIVVKLNHNFEMFTVAIITLLNVAENLCHKWQRMCSVCRNHNPVLSCPVLSCPHL